MLVSIFCMSTREIICAHRIMTTAHIPEEITRNQKIDLEWVQRITMSAHILIFRDRQPYYSLVLTSSPAYPKEPHPKRGPKKAPSSARCSTARRSYHARTAPRYPQSRQRLPYRVSPQLGAIFARFTSTYLDTHPRQWCSQTRTPASTGGA